MDEKEAEARPVMGTIFLGCGEILMVSSCCWVDPSLGASSVTVTF